MNAVVALPGREKMEKIEREHECTTLHPAFKDVCLNRYVLEVAAVGLKNTVLFAQGRKTESEFYRSVAYRQFVRFIWESVGSSKRIALPCCVYDRIRKEFPNESEPYHGYEAEEDEGEGQ